MQDPLYKEIKEVVRELKKQMGEFVTLFQAMATKESSQISQVDTNMHVDLCWKRSSLNENSKV